MAKMFYTMEETKAALGKSEEDIKQLAREGRLREFRDGPRLMFKADQVELLKSELGPGDGELAPEGSGSLDPGKSSGALSLADSDAGRSSGLAMSLKEDTALAGDLGLSGSVGSGVAGSGVAGSGIGTGIGSASGAIPSPRSPSSS